MPRRNPGSFDPRKGNVWGILWVGASPKAKIVDWIIRRIEETGMLNLLIIYCYAASKWLNQK